jgi:hypothetical protein
MTTPFCQSSFSEAIRSGVLRNVMPQPWDKLVEAELIGFVERGDKIVGFLGVGCETRTVDGDICSGESRAFVAVDERMVLRKALPKRRGFLDQVGVISGLPADKGRLPAVLDL